ncbi:MAG: DNA mismatch repair protein MutS [Pirellulales bacterium]|nr:DNA mismatch repair protein MutS [Pirellulales bacterium]
MMQQYEDAKASCPDALLLFRMGDFYELFHDDAEKAHRLLGITLTSRDKSENPIPMAGFPHHQLDGYLAKLIAAGCRVAVCDQVEDPKKAKGLVKREVTRLVTPGTLTDESLLDPRTSNFLAAWVPGEVGGLAWIDVSTGRFYAASVGSEQLADELARVRPAELLLSEDASEAGIADEWSITPRAGWTFSPKSALPLLEKQFGTKSLEGFGFGDQDTAALCAAGGILSYLQETQRTELAHIDRLSPYESRSALQIDEASRSSLEISRTVRSEKRDGSLLDVMDRTVTAMGGRLLGEWLANPLTDRVQIDARLKSVGELLEAPATLASFGESLAKIYDMERLLARATTGRASPRDLQFMGRTLATLPEIKQPLGQLSTARFSELDAEFDLCSELKDRLNSALQEDCPLTSREGDFIREGFHTPLDELRSLSSGGKQWIARYQAEEAERSGITNLKVGYNRVFGYYLEVTHAHRDKVPETYIRKQTLKNAERYITPELKEHEEKVLQADSQANELEYELYLQLRDAVTQAAERLRRTAAVLAELDVFCSLASLARARDYCRPVVNDLREMTILGGRHPVLDVLSEEGSFVPNDTELHFERQRLLLITGPNMAGKSTYIRQVALIAIMAQIGSYVPATSAEIGIADRIYARVGASDQLARGQSTFMVEMLETARILNTATDRSLVILDEIGRGTSTYDGVSLAWAVVEYLHNRVQCRALFATHYHELTELEERLEGVANLNVSVREWENEVVFLHKIAPGAANKSYGIHVASLAGVPKEVQQRAHDILAHLEQEHHDALQPGESVPNAVNNFSSSEAGDLQMSLFGAEEHPLIEKIRQLDLESLTPLETMQRLGEWQEQLEEESQAKPR